MGNTYLYCAVIGGTLFLCQMLLTLVGVGSHELGLDHDGGMGEGHDHGGGEGHDHGHGGQSGLGGYISFRSLVAAVTFFGLCGVVANSSMVDGTITFLCAVGGGVAALLLVGVLMKEMNRFKDEGTCHIEQALGKQATVYLTIPAHSAGQGKVTVNVQNRTMEYLAITKHETLPTGAKVLVVDVIDGDTLEVEPDK